MADVIAVAGGCSQADWTTSCIDEQRSVGVVFDHIAELNPEVVRWVQKFFNGRTRSWRGSPPVRAHRSQAAASGWSPAEKEPPRRPRRRSVRRAAQGSPTELGRRPAECRIGLAVNRSRPHRAGRDVAKSRPALRSSVRGPAEN